LVSRCDEIEAELLSSEIVADPNSHQILAARNGRKVIPWSKPRIRVMRRDHYRCRACDAKGDEITLLIYSIHPNVISTDGLLTLCSGCEATAKSLAIQAEDIPQVLQALWHHLHRTMQGARGSKIHREAAQQQKTPWVLVICLA
jgi:hypothetical protein